MRRRGTQLDAVYILYRQLHIWYHQEQDEVKRGRELIVVGLIRIIRAVCLFPHITLTFWGMHKVGDGQILSVPGSGLSRVHKTFSFRRINGGEEIIFERKERRNLFLKKYGQQKKIRKKDTQDYFFRNKRTAMSLYMEI